MTLVCEDLATKAELAELKQKLNQLLGKQVGGGEIDVLEQGDFEGTLIKEKLDLAESAIQDIELHDGGGSKVSIVDDIALLGLVEGSHKLVKTQGKTLTNPLSFLTETTKKTVKTLIQNRSIGKVVAVGAIASSANIAVVASLASIVTSLGLSIAQTKVSGFRMDQIEKMVLSYNQDYTNIINLLDKQKGNINKASQEIQKANKQIAENQIINQELAKALDKSELNVQNLNNEVDIANQHIAKLETANLEIIEQIENFEGEVTAEIAELKTANENLTENLTIAKTNIANLTKVIEQLGTDVAMLKARNTELKIEIDKLKIQHSITVADIIALKKEIELNETLTNSKLKLLSAKLVLVEDALKKGNTSGGGFPLSAQTEVANTQMKTLELTNLLAGNPLNNSDLQIETYQLGFDNPFTSIFSQLLPQINITNPEVTPMQLNEITTAIGEKIDTKFDDIGLGNVPGDVTTIKNNTTPEKIKQNVDESICKQTQPDKCIEKNIKQPLEEQINNTYNNLNINLLAIPNLFSDCCDLMAQKIQELEDMLTKAWNSTTEDKKINAINNSLLLHNAMLLSQNINETIPKIQNFSLQNIAPTDYQENPLDLSGKITDILTPFPDSTSNLDNPLSLQSILTTYNQTIQSTYGTIFALENVKTSTLQGLKTLGNYTTTLGNLLQIQGVLESNSYPWMWENFNLETALNGFIGKYSVSQSLIDDISSLSIQGLPIIENANQTIAENQEFISIDAQIEQLKADYTQERQQLETEEYLASLSPEIDRLDLIKLEPEEYGG